MELLRTIAREEPSSIRETARLVNRDVRQVHRNLSELESLGLIDLKTDGQSKRPTVWYDPSKWVSHSRRAQNAILLMREAMIITDDTDTTDLAAQGASPQIV